MCSCLHSDHHPDPAAVAQTQKGFPPVGAHRRLATRSYFNVNATPERSRYGVLGCLQTNPQFWHCAQLLTDEPTQRLACIHKNWYMHLIICLLFGVCARQVLRKAFPGVLLVPDICGLERLPKVLHAWISARPTMSPLGRAAPLTNTPCVRGVHIPAHPSWLPARLPKRPCAERAVPRSVSCRRRCCRCCPTQETELVAAGFPCIDVSRAGLRQGLDGPVRAEQALCCQLEWSLCVSTRVE